MYAVLRLAFRVLAAPLFRLRIDGAERIPTQGGAILVAAHRSWLDPALVAAACGRPVSFVVLDTVYARPWLGWLCRAARSIPVPAAGSGALGGTREALRRLRRGEIIGIFPEGRVYTDEQPGTFRPGAAMLAVRAGVPVVPLRLHGSAEAWPRGARWPRPGRITVHVGAAIRLEALSGSGAHDVVTAAGLLERAIEDLHLHVARRAAGDGSAAEGESA